MRWPVPCIRLSLTLPYLPPPLSKSSSSIPFISSFLGESVYRVNTTERITRDTIGFWPPLLFRFFSCTWPSIRESFYWNIWHFSELMLNKECCMIERSYRQEEVWQWRICDKKDSLFFLSFSKSRRVEKYHLWKFLPNSVIFNFMIRVNGDEDF